MTTPTVDSLDELDRLGPPPCGVTYTTQMGKIGCGRPSVARIYSECHCRGSSFEFICGPCLDNLRAGKYRCGKCYRTDIFWRMA